MRGVTILLFIVLLYSCKKEENPSNPYQEDIVPCYYHDLSADLKKINYLTGSYWILFDSLRNRYDSLVVSSNYTTVIQYPMHKGMVCPNKANRRILTVNLYYYTVPNAVTKASDEENYVIILAAEWNDLVIHGHPNCYPAGCGSDVYFDYDSIPQPFLNTTVTKFDSLFIYNRYFKRVVNVSIGSKEKNYYYFNVDTGFLKFYSCDSTGKVTTNKFLIRNKILK